MRHRWRTEAALSVTAPGTAASHGSAAVLGGLAVLSASIATVHLTRAGAGTTKRRAGHHLHAGRLDDDEVVDPGGLLVTASGRTVVDVLRLDGWSAGLVVADQAVRAGLSLTDLAAAVERQRGTPGTAPAGRLVAAVDPGAETPGETLTRVVLCEAMAGLGLPRPESQHRVADARRTAYADLRVGRLLVEFDGRVKYGRATPWGDPRTPEDVLWEEKRREDWLRDQGYSVVRVVWEDLWGTARERTVARLRHAVVARSGLL